MKMSKLKKERKKEKKRSSPTYKSTTSCPCFLRAETTWLKARLQAGVGGIVPLLLLLVSKEIQNVVESIYHLPK